MNSIISDPDTKINMSLDEIIRLSRGQINNNLQGKRTKKKKGRFLKNITSDHSVPLLTSTEGVSIYVSKRSPLLSPDIKQSFLKAVTNRALNAELLKKSTRIIPAKYKIIKTNNGVERVLVPVKDYVCKPLRKLHQQRRPNYSNTQTDDIPSLLSVPISNPAYSPYNALKQKLDSAMEIDTEKNVGDNGDDDNDVVVLDFIKKEPELIDIEMDPPVFVCENEESQSNQVKTLNDRFTRLTGTFQF